MTTHKRRRFGKFAPLFKATSFAAVLGIATAGQAAVYDWLGSTSTLWTNSANWTPAPPTFPGSGDNTRFGVGATVTSSTIDLSGQTVTLFATTPSAPTGKGATTSSINFSNAGSVTGYSIQNGTITPSAEGFLNISAPVTVNLNISSGGTGRMFQLTNGATLNIGTGVTHNNRFDVYGGGGVTATVNVNAVNYCNNIWLIGSGNSSTVSTTTDSQDLTVNINASQTFTGAGTTDFNVGWTTAGHENKVVIRNGAAVSTASRLVLGGIAGAANSGSGRLVIGDATTTGSFTSSSTLTYFRAGAGAGTGTVDVVNGTLVPNEAGVVNLGYGGQAASRGVINIFTNGLVDTRSSFRLQTGASTGNAIINFAGGTMRVHTTSGAAQRGNLIVGNVTVNVLDGGAVFDMNGQTDTVINAALLEGGSGVGVVNFTNSTGTGMLTLNGANTFQGPTIVRAGTLAVDSGFATVSPINVRSNAGLGFKTASIGSNPNVTLADGANLRSLQTTAGAALNLNTLNLGQTTNGATVNFQFNPAGTVYDSINVVAAGGLTINGGRLSVYYENTTTAFDVPGVYPLFSYNTSFTGNVTNLVVANPAVTVVYAISNYVAGSQVVLVVSPAPVNFWTVDADGDWGTSGNWALNVVPSAVNAVARFGNVITAPRVVNNEAVHTAGTITLNSATPGASYTIGGSATVTMNNGSSNALVEVQGNSHTISAPLSLASNTVFAVMAGQTLTLSGAVTGAGASIVTNNAGAVSITGTNATPVTMGAGSLTVTGSGQLTAPLTVVGGTVFLQDESNLGPNPGAPNANQVLLNGGTLRGTATFTIDDSNRGITLGTNGGSLGADSGATLTMANPITGSGSLTKTFSAGGIVVLAANNTYGGTTIINTGELQLGNGGTTGTLGNGTNVQISGSSILTLNRSDLTSLTNSILLGTGGGVIRNSGPNPVTLSGQVNANTNLLTVDTATADLILPGGNFLNYNGITKSSGGTLALTGTHTSSGTGARIQVAAGTLALGSGANWSITTALLDTMRVGSLAGSGASAVVSNGAALTLSGMSLGAVNGSIGTAFLLDGGTVNLVGAAGDVLSLHSGGSGGVNDDLTVNSGTLTATQPDSRVNIGIRGDASFTVNNGTVSLNRAGFGSIGAVAAFVTSGNCSLTVNGGSLNISNQFELMADSSATPARANTIDLNGGALRTVAMNCSSPNSAVTFNFNGGTLVTLGNGSYGGADGLGSLGNFLSGVDVVNVQSGGAIIDTAGKDATISQALQDAGGGGGLTKQGSGALTLGGANAYTGPTLVQAGTLVLYPGHAAPGSITGSSGAGVGFHSTSSGVFPRVPSVAVTSGALEAQFSTSGNPTTPAGYITNLTINGVNQVRVQVGGISAGQFPLFRYGTISGSGSLTPSLPRGVVATLVTNVPNKTIDLVVSSVTPVIWTGAASSLWDTTSTNWSFNGNPTSFLNGDNVLFHDSTSQTNVAIVVMVSPGSMTVSNTANLYTFSSSGAGKLSGSGGLAKKGLNTLTLNADNDFTGDAQIQAGILKMGGFLKLGSSGGINCYVSAGAALDINGADLSITPTVIHIAGSYATSVGAIYSTIFTAANKGLKYVTLTADASIGGLGGGMEFNGGVVNGGGFNLTKVGTDQVTSRNGGVVTNLASLTVATNGGTLGIAVGPTIGSGGFAEFNCPFTLNPGSTFTMFSTPGAYTHAFNNTPITLKGGTIFIQNNVNFSINTPTTLANNSTSIVSLVNGTPSFNINGPIGGSGSLQKDAAVTKKIFLNGANSYTGTTIVNQGTLTLGASGSVSNSPVILVANGATFEVSAVSGGFALQNGQTLTGVGTVEGNVTSLSGATVAPGTATGLGTLMISGDLTSSGNFGFNVNRSASPANSVLSVSGALAQNGGGTVAVANLGPALVTGDNFPLLTLPLLPDGGLLSITTVGVTWTNKLAADGSIQVVSVAALPTTPTNLSFTISGGNLSVTWPANYTGWLLQTNASLLTTNWVTVTGSAGTNSMTFTVNPANPSLFYRLRLP